MATAGSVNYSRLKVLLILEGPGATVLSHILSHGTHNTPPVDLDVYLDRLPSNSTANYTRLTTKQRKNLFNHSQMKQIRANPLWLNFDISLLFSGIRLACENVALLNDDAKWKNNDKEMEGLISRIKDERNDCVHERPQMTDSEFEAKVSELEDLFIKTLETVKVRYSVSDQDFRCLETEVRSEIIKIKGCLNLERIWCVGKEKLLQQFKETTRNHLNDLYQCIHFFNPLSFLSGSPEEQVPIQDIFSKIMLKENQKDGEIDCLDLLKPAQPSQNQQSSQSARLACPALIVVSGVAGSGKTTLLNFIMSEWIEDRHICRVKYLDQYDIVVRILCRERDGASLKEYLELIMPESFVLSPYLMALLKQCKVLFLIDGLDECNSESAQLVRDTLENCKRVPGFTAVCTSRPERVQDFWPLVPESYRKCELHLKSIPHGNRTEFVMKYYNCLAPAGSPDPNKLRHLMKIIGWKDHFGLPLNLLFIAVMFLDERDGDAWSSTQSSLYVTMHEWCVEKLQDRLARKNPETEKHTRWIGIKEVLMLMYRMALEGLLQDRLSLSEEDILRLKECCKTQNLLSQELMAAFLCLRKFVSKRVEHEKYYFPHKGLQEFFAAHHIVERLQNGSVHRSIRHLLQEFMQEKPLKLHSLRNLLHFVAGLLCRPMSSFPGAIEEAVDLVAESGVWECGDWLTLVVETEVNEDVLKRVVHHIRGNHCDDTDHEEIPITDTNLRGATALLPLVPRKRVNIVIHEEPVGMDKLVHAVSCRQLVLWQHYKHHASCAASYPFLRDLGSRDHLKRFVGHLDAEQIYLLPEGLLQLYLVVASSEQGQNLLRELADGPRRFPRLDTLVIHVPVTAVTSSALSPLPDVANVSLTLSCVGDQEVEAACRVAAALCPRKSGYSYISFPEASLGFQGWIQLMKKLKEAGVRVNGEFLVPETITEDEEERLGTVAHSLLGCYVFRKTEEGLWWSVFWMSLFPRPWWE